MLPAKTQEIIRLATYNTELSRNGPGLLLRDIRKGEDPQVEAVAQVIAQAKPDIITLQGVDYDHDLRTLAALRDRIAHYDHSFEYMFAARPNTGMATKLDLNGDGRLGQPQDAQGYGEFAGQGGMAVLSRFPIVQETFRDLSARLWQDKHDALLILPDGDALLSASVARIQRLPTVAHWDLPIQINGKELRLLTFHASPPVFDGPEDRNGRRNHDEITFWLDYLDGRHGTAPKTTFVIAGDANLDPVDGDGRKSAIQRLLNDSRIFDPKPMRKGVRHQGEGHEGDPRLDTVDWPAPDPGSLRVSYILPSRDLTVQEAGIASVDAVDPIASRHRLVWVDLRMEP